ncbi:uncharacterized protein AB675_11004 [Cyphellophora attinorum]|uniref:RING-type domain-containing protein n=1 Tax=Cyphellophora attinorum TaxID=1664694 RepID=A0A0N1GY64_9EURO|nr:uncharacterized protein AB675_11004 [Phialophora attinorum]KPI35564.1 hypothetical protein AB675_11004 [Phialophora attinorum]
MAVTTSADRSQLLPEDPKMTETISADQSQSLPGTLLEESSMVKQLGLSKAILDRYHQSMQDVINDLHAEFDREKHRLQEEVEATKQITARLTDELRESTETCQHHATENQQLRARIQALSDRLESSTKTNQRLAPEIEQLRTKNFSLVNTLSASTKSCQHQAKENQRLRDENQSLLELKDLATKTVDSLGDELEELDDKNVSLQEELDSLTDTCHAKDAEIQRLLTKVQTLQDELESQGDNSSLDPTPGRDHGGLNNSVGQFFGTANSTPIFQEKNCSNCESGYGTDEDDQRGVILPCGHVFHWPCICCSMKQSMQCPICRQEMAWSLNMLPEVFVLEQDAGTAATSIGVRDGNVISSGGYSTGSGHQFLFRLLEPQKHKPNTSRKASSTVH